MSSEEIKKPLGRDEIVNALQSLNDVGLPFEGEDQRVVQVQRMISEYYDLLDKEAVARGLAGRADRIKLSVDRTMLPIDAGFTDKRMADQICNDFLPNELAEAENLKDEELIRYVKDGIRRAKAVAEGKVE